MSSDNAIEINNLSKSYQVYTKPSDRLKQTFFRGKRKYYTEFHALSNISFNVKKGETIGIIGRNGSGKSTILQILAGTLKPTSGDFKVNGRVSALLELGSGFNPEFTGRENIYMNGAILGISHKEMKLRIKEIEDFAEIGDFIDQPVKTYSSGMYVRLAFAVAINVDADILIVDEALAVGDTKFQMKCIEKMKEIKKSGTTILFVSHAGEQVKRFCDRAVWLEKGQIKMIGKSSEVVNKYEDSLQLEVLKNKNIEENHIPKGDSIAEDEIALTIEDSNTNISSMVAKILNVDINTIRLETFGELIVEVTYQIFEKEISNFLLGVAIYGNDRKYIFGPNTYLDKIEVPSTRGIHKVQYIIKKIPLLAGSYFIDAGIFTDEGLVCLDYKNDVIMFSIDNEYFAEGLVYIEHEWRVLK